MQDIIFILGNAQLGGTEKQTTRLAVELSKIGMKVQFIFLRTGGPLLKYLTENQISYQVLGLDFRRTPLTVFKIIRLWKFLRTSNPKFVHALLPENVIIGILSSKLVIPRAKRIAGIRGFNPSKNWLSGKLYKLALQNSTGIFTNSTHLLTELKLDSGKINRVKLFTNGVDIAPKREPRTADEDLRAVVVANLYSYKNHDELILALAAIGCKVNVTFFGAGPEEARLRNLTLENGLGDHIIFAGNVPLSSEKLQEFDFAIHPSKKEGMSNAILEELANGLPVIASNISENLVLVQNGFNGFIYDLGDVSQLGKIILKIQNEPRLLNNLADHAVESVKKYDWADIALQYRQLLAELNDWS